MQKRKVEEAKKEDKIKKKIDKKSIQEMSKQWDKFMNKGISPQGVKEKKSHGSTLKQMNMGWLTGSVKPKKTEKK